MGGYRNIKGFASVDTHTHTHFIYLILFSYWNLWPIRSFLVYYGQPENIYKLVCRSNCWSKRSMQAFAPIGLMSRILSVHKRSKVSSTKLSWAVKRCHCRQKDSHYYSWLISCQQRHVPGERKSHVPLHLHSLLCSSGLHSLFSIELAIQHRFNQLKQHCCKLLYEWKF